MACSCKNCAAGFWARYCVATRELTPAETARVEQILARRSTRLPSREGRAPTPEQVEKVREIHNAKRAVRGPEPAPPSPSSDLTKESE